MWAYSWNKGKLPGLISGSTCMYEAEVQDHRNLHESGLNIKTCTVYQAKESKICDQIEYENFEDVKN